MVLNHAITTDIHISKINLQFTDEWIRQYVQQYNEKETPTNDTIFLRVVSKLAFWINDMHILTVGRKKKNQSHRNV